jgi:hypothetical protein
MFKNAVLSSTFFILRSSCVCCARRGYVELYRELKTSQCFVFANARDENLSPLCILLWCEMRNIRANSNSFLRDEHVKQNLAFLLSLLMCECIFYLNLHCLSTMKRKCNTQSSRASKVLVTQTGMQPGKRGCCAHCIDYIILLFSSSSIFCLRLRRPPNWPKIATFWHIQGAAIALS